MSRKTMLLVAAVLAIAAFPARAQDDDAPVTRVTVAVLDFASSAEETKALAATLPDLIEASLPAVPGLRLVTRRELDRIQKEQSLNLAGLVTAGQGARVGQLVGADVLIVGRVTRVDRELLLMAKAIGSSTGVFFPAVVRGADTGSAEGLADLLGKKLVSLLTERAAELLPPPDPVEKREKEIAKVLAAREGPLPKVGVVVFEDHFSSREGADPAAETEILFVLERLGFPLMELSGDGVRDWLRRFQGGEVDFSGENPLKVDVVVVGRGFSEFAGRVGELVSAKARLEVRAVRVKDGKILAVHRASTAAADLSEVFAGKKALQELGRVAALELALAVAAAGEEE